MFREPHPFDLLLNEVKYCTGASELEIDELRSLARQLATTTKFTAVQVAAHMLRLAGIVHTAPRIAEAIEPRLDHVARYNL